jgi:hypothetical protein
MEVWWGDGVIVADKSVTRSPLAKVTIGDLWLGTVACTSQAVIRDTSRQPQQPQYLVNTTPTVGRTHHPDIAIADRQPKISLYGKIGDFGHE